MSPREYDESDARIRPSRSTRPRSKDRPSHNDAISALVTTVDRGRQTCITEDGTIVTAMRARELGPKSVVTGDNVSLVGDVSGTEGSLARIVAVQERRNSLSRTVDDAAQVERTIVSNIDQLVIVVAAANPEPRRGLIDRFLVSAFTEGIVPKIVVTKTDISQVPAFLAEYEDLDVEIIHTAIKSDSREKDLEKLHQVLEGKISVLVGHSGVGKSTLINALVPESNRATGDVNEATGRGRHTSSSAIALPLSKTFSREEFGWIIDTPGVRSFGIAHVQPSRVISAFSEFSEAVAHCPKNCSHNEKECALNNWPGFTNQNLARLASLRRVLSTQ